MGYWLLNLPIPWMALVITLSMSAKRQKADTQNDALNVG